MFSDRFSGIRGQREVVRGKIGRRNGEGNGGMGRAFRGWRGEWELEGGAGDDGGGAPPPTGRLGRMENGWPSGVQQPGEKADWS